MIPSRDGLLVSWFRVPVVLGVLGFGRPGLFAANAGLHLPSGQLPGSRYLPTRMPESLLPPKAALAAYTRSTWESFW